MHTVPTQDSWLRLKLYDALIDTGGLNKTTKFFESYVKRIEEFIDINPSQVSQYPRGSLGRLLCYRKRYSDGFQVFSNGDSPETLEYDGPPKEVNMRLMNVTFPNYPSE